MAAKFLSVLRHWLKQTHTQRIQIWRTLVMTHVFRLFFFRGSFPRVKVNVFSVCCHSKDTYLSDLLDLTQLQKILCRKRKSKLTAKTIMRFIAVRSGLAALDFILLEIHTITNKTMQLSSVSRCAFYQWWQDIPEMLPKQLLIQESLNLNSELAYSQSFQQTWHTFNECSNSKIMSYLHHCIWVHLYNDKSVRWKVPGVHL